MELSYKDQMKMIESFQVNYPVETMPIAAALGMNVYRSTGWPNDLSGMITKDKENGGTSGYAIFVNGDHPVTRRRFTIAHEIGHFILHRDYIGDGIVDDAMYRSKLSSDKERQANDFAAMLLMPWHLIRQAMTEGNDTVEALAAVFNVSISAMSIRLGVPYETKSTFGTPKKRANVV